MEKIRLQKFLSEQGLLSRRAAEREIEQGNVSVNGVVAALGDKVDPEADEVVWKGQKVSAERTRKLTVMLYKPAGTVTTMHDEKNRPCVADLLRDVPEKVYPVGRLDMYSEGLLICTNDGELANLLMHPSHEIAKKYLLTLKGALTAEEVMRIAAPTSLDGYELRPVEVRNVVSDVRAKDGMAVTTAVVTLREGRNREIRRLCETNGMTVVRLKRVCEGPVQLGDLAPGTWRYLSEKELNSLRRAAVNTKVND